MDDQEIPLPVSTTSTYWLSEGDKSNLSDKSDKGDKNAAFRPAQYYSFIDFNGDKEQYWLERSATAGHAVAQYNLAFFLYNKENPEVDAALHWQKWPREMERKKLSYCLMTSAQPVIDNHINLRGNERN